MLQKLRSNNALATCALYAVALIGASATGAVFAASSAYAQEVQVSIRSEIKVERVSTDSSGRERTELLDPQKVTVIPGDQLVITNHYSNDGNSPRENYVATNPLNPAIAFVSVEEDWAEVSVDGGRTWGKLENLTKTIEPSDDAADSVATTRSAGPADVTHVRWRFDKPLPPGAKGKLTFRGVVR